MSVSLSVTSISAENSPKIICRRDPLGPAVGAYSAPPDPLAGLKGGEEGNDEKWRAGEGWEGKSEGVESVNKYWLRACLRLGRLSAVLLCVFK